MTRGVRRTFRVQTLLMALLLGSSSQLWAHGEEIEVSEVGTKGPVQLTKAQTDMLAIKVAQATKRPMAQLLNLNGQIQLWPDAQSDVSVRISGAISAIDVNLGDKVTVGQRLAIVQSRLIGNPPPSVVVKAPIAGVIDARNVNLGQAVEPNTVLFHISNRDQLLVVAQVYEEDIEKIKVGQVVNIHPLSYPKKNFPGKVLLMEPNLDALTRTANVRISLSNPQDLLKPGMFVRASVVLSRNEASLTVPNESLLQADDQNFVFVRNGMTYDRVVVHVGASDDEYTEILEGLVPGDEVVIQGNRELYTMWLSGSGKPKENTEESH